MTKPARDANPRWPGFLLAALVAVLVTLFGAGSASAATASAAQTRVGPHTPAAQVLVGPDVGIGAGQRLGNDPPAYDSALATGVAAKAGTGRLSTVLQSGERGAIGRGLRPNQMNQAIKRGQGPRGITRIDTPKIPHEKLHATFEDGSALNVDGTWKHGGIDLTRDQMSWLVENGWTLP